MTSNHGEPNGKEKQMENDIEDWRYVGFVGGSGM